MSSVHTFSLPDTSKWIERRRKGEKNTVFIVYNFRLLQRLKASCNNFFFQHQVSGWNISLPSILITKQFTFRGKKKHEKTQLFQQKAKTREWLKKENSKKYMETRKSNSKETRPISYREQKAQLLPETITWMKTEKVSNGSMLALTKSTFLKCL